MATLTLQSIPMPAELPDMPIEPSWIQEGNPVAKGTILMQSDDKKVSNGYWTCEPGKFEWTFGWDEFVHVLEGEVDMNEDGTDNTITLTPGMAAHFPLGMKTHWHVKKAVRKYFVIRTADALEL